MSKTTVIMVKGENERTVVAEFNSKTKAYKYVMEKAGDHIINYYDKHGSRIFEIWPHDGEEAVTYII